MKMENRSIIGISLPDKENGHHSLHLASLMQKASHASLLTADVKERIQGDLLILLRNQINGITRGESSSVTVEVAEQLMDGIGYCIDLALSTESTKEESLTLLQTKSIAQLYQTGADLLQSYATACEALLARVRSTRIATVNEGYNIVLDTSFPLFLRQWKCSPYPHDFVVVTEYPLAVQNNQSGILGVHARLSALALENRFCARFAGCLDELLDDYARQTRVPSENAYVNLFTIALQNLLLNRLLGRTGLTLTASETDALQAQLAPLTAEQREQMILGAAAFIIADCKFDNAKLDSYILKNTKQFADGINMTGGRLEAFGVVHSSDEETLYTDGKRLENDVFTAIINEILLCDTAAEKIEVIKDELHSLVDLCDMLGANCIFEKEFEEIFSSFDSMTYALILTKLQIDVKAGFIILQSEVDWQIRLVEYLNALDSSQRAEILRLYLFFAK
ncbi:DUF6179 domain-containing protein [Oscillospiraceae bacterium PP1C4]